MRGLGPAILAAACLGCAQVDYARRQMGFVKQEPEAQSLPELFSQLARRDPEQWTALAKLCADGDGTVGSTRHIDEADVEEARFWCQKGPKLVVTPWYRKERLRPYDFDELGTTGRESRDNIEPHYDSDRSIRAALRRWIADRNP